MELRIGINNRRKQFAGIGRDHLCDFQDGVQYQASNRFTVQSMLYCIMVNVKLAICAEKCTL